MDPRFERSSTNFSERGPQFAEPVAAGLSGSSRPWNHFGPVHCWPTRVEPFAVSEPFAWRPKKAWPMPVSTAG